MFPFRTGHPKNQYGSLWEMYPAYISIAADTDKVSHPNSMPLMECNVCPAYITLWGRRCNGSRPREVYRVVHRLSASVWLFCFTPTLSSLVRTACLLFLFGMLMFHKQVLINPWAIGPIRR